MTKTALHRRREKLSVKQSEQIRFNSRVLFGQALLERRNAIHTLSAFFFFPVACDSDAANCCCVLRKAYRPRSRCFACALYTIFRTSVEVGRRTVTAVDVFAANGSETLHRRIASFDRVHRVCVSRTRPCVLKGGNV